MSLDGDLEGYINSEIAVLKIVNFFNSAPKPVLI